MALSFKVSEKGAVSVYGLGRFPVTLYGEQWDTLLGDLPALQAFIAENRSRLSTKSKPAPKARWRELEEQDEQAKADAILNP